MCYYVKVICESCSFVTSEPPTYCDKIRYGLICSKSTNPSLEHRPIDCILPDTATEQDLSLYGLLDVHYKVVNYTECICGLLTDYDYDNYMECNSYSDLVSEPYDYSTSPDSCDTECIDDTEFEALFNEMCGCHQEEESQSMTV